VKISSIRVIHTSLCYSYGVCDCSLPLLESFFFVQISGRDFLLGGGGAVTPLVFVVAIVVQSMVLHLVIAGNQGHVNLV
jgi:hypothetical protein